MGEADRAGGARVRLKHMMTQPCRYAVRLNTFRENLMIEARCRLGCGLMSMKQGQVLNRRGSMAASTKMRKTQWAGRETSVSFHFRHQLFGSCGEVRVLPGDVPTHVVYFILPDATEAAVVAHVETQLSVMCQSTQIICKGKSPLAHSDEREGTNHIRAESRTSSPFNAKAQTLPLSEHRGTMAARWQSIRASRAMEKAQKATGAVADPSLDVLQSREISKEAVTGVTDLLWLLKRRPRRT